MNDIAARYSISFVFCLQQNCTKSNIPLTSVNIPSACMCFVCNNREFIQAAELHGPFDLLFSIAKYSPSEIKLMAFFIKIILCHIFKLLLH